MLLRSTAKAWRGATYKASVSPNRSSKSYRAGRALGQLARGQKPTKYSEPTGEHQVLGKKNIANITAYKDNRRYDYAYDADSGNLYDIQYGLQYDANRKKFVGKDGGIKVTDFGRADQYQPTNYGTHSDRPGQIPGRGTKGRLYTGVDAVIKALQDEGADVYALDKTPGKGKKASTTNGVVNWRSPIQMTGEYIDPRKRHEIPTGPGAGYGTGYQGNPAKTAHNMYWRRAPAYSNPEKLAISVLNRGTALDTLEKVSGRSWRKPGQQPPPAGPSPTGPPQGPQPGPGAGPSAGTGFGGNFESWMRHHGINPGNLGANWRPKSSGPPGQPPGQTPGPAPSQNQATPKQSVSYTAWHSPHTVKPSAGQTRSGAASAGLGDAFSTDSHEYAAQYGTPARYRFNMKNPYVMSQSEWRELDRGPQASFENSRKYRQKLEEQGHDGIIVTHRDGSIEYIAFDRTKSDFRPFDEDSSATSQQPSQNQASPPAVQGSQSTQPSAPPAPGGNAAALPKPTGTGIVPVNQKPFQYAEPPQQEPQKKSWRNPQEGDRRGKFVYTGGQWQEKPSVISPTPKPAIPMPGRTLSPKEVKAYETAEKFIAEQADAEIDQSLADVILGNTDEANPPVVNPEPPPTPPAAKQGRVWPARATSQEIATPEVPPELPGYLQGEINSLAKAGNGNPYRPQPEVYQELQRLHDENAFGIRDNEGLIGPDGKPIDPQIIAMLAKTQGDIGMTLGGNQPRVVKNPFAYDKDTIDTQIKAYEELARQLTDAVNEDAANPRPEADYDQARRKIGLLLGTPQNPETGDLGAGPLAHFQRMKGLADQEQAAIAAGDRDLAETFRKTRELEESLALRRSPQIRDAFTTRRYDTGTLVPGAFIVSPQKPEASVNVMERPDYARALPSLAAKEPKRADYPTTKEFNNAFNAWKAESIGLSRVEVENELEQLKPDRASYLDTDSYDQAYRDYAILKDQVLRQKAIDETNLAWSKASGQGGKNPADTKGFSAQYVTDVPLEDNLKDLYSRIPTSHIEELDLDTQFENFLANPDADKSRFDYSFRPERIEPRQNVPLEDQIASALAGRFASISRYGGSLGFASNSVEAARNQEMLAGEGGDEGYGPQKTNRHWRSSKSIAEQMKAIEGGGKIAGMDDLEKTTFDATYPEYQAKASEFVATLPPDMTDKQLQAAADEFIRGEFNRRVQSDFERYKNPEADDSGQHNIFRLPNTKSMSPDGISVRDLFDKEIPGIATPQSGDPYEAWNQRLKQEEADQNIATAYQNVGMGEDEAARSFWNDRSREVPGELQGIANRYTEDEKQKPWRIDVSQGLSKNDMNYREFVQDGWRRGDAPALPPIQLAAKMSKGLRRVGKAARQDEALTPPPAPENLPKADLGNFIRESIKNAGFGNLNKAENQVFEQYLAGPKQVKRQEKLLFRKSGARKSQNTERIEANEFELGDVVNLHAPGENGDKTEQARVVDIANGQVLLKDGDTFGNILLDIDDPSRSGINVQSIEPHSDRKIQAGRNLANILKSKAPVQPKVSVQKPPPEIPADLMPGGTTTTQKKPQKSSGPRLDSEALDPLYGTPFEQIVNGGVSKIASGRTKKGKQQGEYDGGMDFGSYWNTQIFSRTGGRKPDQVHAELVDKGLMPSDSTVDDMWSAISQGISSYEAGVETTKTIKTVQKQASAVQKEVFSPKASKRNPIAVKGQDLVVGQKYEFAVPNARGRRDETEVAEVVDIDEDGIAILEDGPRYGQFPVAKNQTFYAKKFTESELLSDPDPWDDPAQTFDPSAKPMLTPSAPNAFNLANEQVNKNFDTNQGILFEEDDEATRQLIEEQRRRNKKQLKGQNDFWNDVPF